MTSGDRRSVQLKHWHHMNVRAAPALSEFSRASVNTAKTSGLQLHLPVSSRLQQRDTVSASPRWRTRRVSASERGKPLTLPDALERQILTTSRFTGPTVTIEVGATDNVDTHTIHADILEKQSPFWKSALKKCWEEGAKGKIKLPEDDRDAVGTYLEWIYSHTIELSSLTNEELTAKDVTEEFDHLARAYVLGEKVHDDLFCNSVMDAIIQRVEGVGKVRWHPTTDTVGIIYNGTPEGSPARKLCLYLHTNYGDSSWIDSIENREHPDFLRDLARSLLDAPKMFPVESVYSKRKTWHKRS